MRTQASRGSLLAGEHESDILGCQHFWTDISQSKVRCDAMLVSLEVEIQWMIPIELLMPYREDGTARLALKAVINFSMPLIKGLL